MGKKKGKCISLCDFKILYSLWWLRLCGIVKAIDTQAMKQNSESRNRQNLLDSGLGKQLLDNTKRTIQKILNTIDKLDFDKIKRWVTY